MHGYKISYILTIILVAVIFILACIPVLAQSGGTYDLTWSTIDGGGGNSTGGAYMLSGTCGQPDAGVISGGVYILSGGFWVGSVVTEPQPSSQIFLPLIIR